MMNNHNRFESPHGLVVEIVPARLHRVRTERVGGPCEPPMLMMCRVPVALMSGAQSRVEVNVASIVGDGHEVVFLLMRGGGAAAALVFDLVGESAQTALHIAQARGRLDIAMTDGQSTKVVRCTVVEPMRAALARSADRSAVGPEEMAICVRRFLEWLGTAEALDELGVRLDTSSDQPHVVLSLFVEPSAAQRLAGAADLQ